MPLFIIFFAIAGAATLAMLGEFYGWRRVHVVFKPSATVLILVLALGASDPPSSNYQRLLVIALVFSLAGDVFLMAERDLFLPGLLSFLVAHLLYSVAFWQSGEAADFALALVPIVALAAVVLAVLWRHLGEMRIPVLAYVGVIGLMAWLALARAVGAAPTGSALAALGALFFMASDSLLAYDRFVKPFPLAPIAVLSTYYLAQSAIALSLY